MFVPHHFASSTWANHKEKGYSLKTFMLMNTSGMDAQELLTAMRSTYNSFDTIEEGSACVFAKITSPKGEAICLRMDRDYIEVYQKSAQGAVTTLAVWQSAVRFKGFRQDELWCNMISLAMVHNARQKELRPC